MNELVNKYLKEGIQSDKIITTLQPSVVKWSLSRKCIVGENGIEALELITENEQTRLSYENNRLVALLVRTQLTTEDITEINNSEGIICTEFATGFRYGFIPQK